MKNLLFASIAALTLVFASCSKDSDSPSSSNSINDNGTESSIASVQVHTITAEAKVVYNDTIPRLLSTISIFSSNNLVVISTASIDTITMVAGNYTYRSAINEPTTEIENHTTYSVAIQNIQNQDQRVLAQGEGEFGSLKINSVTETVIDLEFNFTSATGETISGSYSGNYSLVKADI